MTVFPIIVADINTADIALLQKDSAVQNIQIDIAVPPIMYETNVTIGARTLQNAGYGGANTSVAVLDTGVKKAHPFLSGKVIYEYCSSTTVAGSSVTLCPDGTEESTALNSAEPCADSVSSGCMHGTHVAGIIAGNRLAVTNPWNNAAIAMAGVAPDAKLVAVQVFSKFTTAANCGTATTCVLSYSSDQLYALDYLYRNRASITPPLVAINMSLGGGKYNAFCDSNGLKSYIDQLRAVNIATIIASGNDSYTDGISGPACISSAIAVGASTTYKQMWVGSTQDQVASFSNAPSAANNVANSNGDRLLDVLAPGFKVLSSVPNSTTNSYEPAGYAYASGTSMATPQVAGTWALLRSISPNASVSQIRDWLYNSGTTINDTRSGTTFPMPRINLTAAYTMLSATATATNTSTKTATATATSINTNTVTKTNTPTSTNTVTKSATTTGTNTATNTATLTNTPTNTATPTKSITNTATTTSTNTNTVTKTATATNTATATVTSLPTDTTYNSGITAIQSSLFDDNPASNAIDGNYNNFTHTNNDDHSWLQLDLGWTRDITQVIVYNRNGCCYAEFNGAVAFLSNVDLGDSRDMDYNKSQSLAWRNVICNNQTSCTTEALGIGYTVTFPAGTTDELGVLLYGHDRNAYWYGSKLSIAETRALAPYQNATGLQVTSAVLAGMVWALENPEAGIIEADELDFVRCLDLQRPYLGNLFGVYTDWTPLTDRDQTLFPDDIDHDDPWQFANVLVREAAVEPMETASRRKSSAA